ncbi:TonB-dependent receptor [Allosphingosinicella deserti]|uniref:TonB-dependent receptor n=1 Tax=Allosphingosinicella deserti TaxID=2116704 RepID=A0A2P7QSB8_9SPHN|nr:TonB-dependent receptor [Sphingomonas deserti]PSJ40868.1 hypothetical protein C7I55_11350 [Sphingomonas deserti]
MIERPHVLACAMLAALTASETARSQSPHAPSGIAKDKAPTLDPSGEEIVVEGRRLTVKRTIEGTTYDVRDSAQAQAGSAADVLNTLPSVYVSPDGNVSVRGDSNVQVYVNGRPSAAMNGDSRASTLQSLSGSAIASVEVITNPSAKFSADGGAIVNIVLKKGQRQGIDGSAIVNAGDHERGNLSLNTSYGAGKLSATLNGSLRDDVRFTEVHVDRRTFDATGRPAGRFLTVSTYTPTHAQSASLNGSLVLAVGRNADIGADLSVSEASPKNRVYERHLDRGGDETLVSDYRRIRGGTYVSGASDLSVYFNRDAGPQTGSLKLVAQHSRSFLRSDRLFTTYHDLPFGAPTGERVLTRTETIIDRAAGDLERPIGASLRLAVGAEWKRERGRFDDGRSAFAPAAPAPAPAPGRFAAVQRTIAAYANIQLRSGAWTLQAGERFEDLRIGTHLATGEVRGTRRFRGLNHSLSAVRDIGDDQAVVRLSRSSQRIDPRALNPALVAIDAQNLYAGNPLLAPQVVTSAEAEYGFKRGAREGTATLYYRRTDDTIADVILVRPDGVLITSKVNSGRAESFGGQLTFSGKIGARLKYSMTGNLFHASLSAPLEIGGGRQSRLSYTGQASLDWTPTTRDQLRIDGNIQGATLIPQGVRSGTSAVNFVWRHTLSPRWTLALTAQGLIEDARVHSVVRTLRALDINDRRNSRRAVLAGASYKFR